MVESHAVENQAVDERAAAATSGTGRGFDQLIGLDYTELTPDRVSAQWTVRPELHQPNGILHGGVLCAVVESVASVAGSVWLGEQGHVVGVNNTTDFLRATREGTLTAVGRPIHRGRTQQLWEVRITDAADRLIAKGQVRLANITDTARLGS
ncbi:PaaI family thioesterase [Rhodococcus sp. HNM0569]|uniref:PaaI family thioesterase n=1 Tax=Rhodococcus sp. HNM0569 TaxID=2716340 RepID=UPI00146AAF91|nr:PaaI family thioesterase [Rhodococcus sp. HNM0569]NLU84760.1 PaaI family thioesterase [Rhodococcus sp. HNM0569]